MSQPDFNPAFATTSETCAALRARKISARELLALSAWKEGKSADALKLSEQISADDAAPRNVRERANLLSELIRGSGNAS